MHHQKTAHAAKGKWRGVLMALGIPEQFLKDDHGPCPMCGGKDRFRWDNKDGHGGYICGQCGAGSGFDLAMKYIGKSWPDIARQIDDLLGNIKPDTVQAKREMSDEDRRQALRSVWQTTEPAQPGDLVHEYMRSRNIEELIYPKALRFAKSMRDGEGGLRAAMVAVVSDSEGTPCTLHRTFLKPDGSGKAEMQSPRKMMPGPIPDGACVRLSEWSSGPLGIAEGIETAMSASAFFDMPVWSAINSNMLSKWTPPEGCDEVAIFGDNDSKFAGQAAAYALAQRLSVKGIAVTVHIPKIVGTDWADEWMLQARKLRRAQNIS